MSAKDKKLSKTKKFRIATEGSTTDGRNIDRAWLEEMAAQYSPNLYGARVNLEHIRGITPDGPFKAYGDVLSLSTAEIDGKLVLLAEISPTEELIALTQKKQKIYPSCEINPKFADTGKAYLVGLAITDSPASLGTEMLAFSAQQGDKSPLLGRKQSKDNLFSAAVDAVEIEFTEDSGGILEKVTSLLSKFKKETPATERVAAIEQALEAGITELSTVIESQEATISKLTASVEKISNDYSSLIQKLSKEPNSSFSHRPESSGGNGSQIELTDC